MDLPLHWFSLKLKLIQSTRIHFLPQNNSFYYDWFIHDMWQKIYLELIVAIGTINVFTKFEFISNIGFLDLVFEHIFGF